MSKRAAAWSTRLCSRRKEMFVKQKHHQSRYNREKKEKRSGCVVGRQMKNCHVLSVGQETYSATLNQTNIGQNNNKFYIIQVLAHDTASRYWLWTHWGRGLFIWCCFAVTAHLPNAKNINQRAAV